MNVTFGFAYYRQSILRIRLQSEALHDMSKIYPDFAQCANSSIHLHGLGISIVEEIRAYQ